MGRWAVVSGAAIVLTVLLSTSVFANVQTRETVRALTPRADALVGPKNLAPIGAAPPVQPAQGWNVTITNKASLVDYPVSVMGAEVYTAGIQMLLEIPSGHHGQVRIQMDVTGGFDPSEAARWVFFQPLYFVTFNLDEGTWGARYFMQAATPVVYRDSETTLTATVRLFENGVLLAQDQQPSYLIDVEPLVRAADVAFRGTVTDADLPAMGHIDLVRIAIDQVIGDPTGELRPGKLVYVRSDDLIREDVVVRLSDPHLAQTLRESANVRLALSLPAMAAPAFVAALFGDRVQGVFRVGSRLLMVVELAVQARERAGRFAHGGRRPNFVRVLGPIRRSRGRPPAGLDHPRWGTRAHGILPRARHDGRGVSVRGAAWTRHPHVSVRGG